MESYLYHSIKWNNFDVLFKILESGYILPRCMLKEKIEDKNNIFNGTKYISLCQKTLMDERERDRFRSAYDELILSSICLVLKPDGINLVYPDYADKDDMSPEEWRNIIFNDGDKRYSYFLDELQTKDKIPLTNLVAVGVSEAYLKYNCTEEERNAILDRIDKLLKKNNIDVPIVNTDSYTFADNKEEIEKSKIKIKTK